MIVTVALVMLVEVVEVAVAEIEMDPPMIFLIVFEYGNRAVDHNKWD